MAECLFHPEATVYHKVPPERMTHKYFHLRGFNQGISDSYTALRAKYLDGKPDKRSSGFFYKIARRIYRKAKNQLARDAEMQKAINEMNSGHTLGYEYHQKLLPLTKSLTN